MLLCEDVELKQLLVGDHVAGGIGRPRDTNQAGLFANVQMFKVDVIFKLAFRQQFNIGASRNKQRLIKPGIGIAEIFRCQRKQHALFAAVGAATGVKIKQIEKGALAAVGQGDILR